jgi:cytochrome P450
LGSKFMEKYGGKMASDNVKLNHITWKLMDERMAKEQEFEKNGGSERKDIAHYLIKSRDPETGKGYTTDELRAESGLIVVAGSDTTSTTIAAAFFYLARNPKVMTRLTKELTSTFADVEEIRTGQKLSSLPYLRAVMDETLRMASAAPGILPREVLAGGIEVDEHHIPPGTQVGSSIYCIHRNEEYYPDAFTFRPERWIVDPDAGVTEEDVAKAHSAFCAFSLGSRACIGKNLAYVELSITLARIVYQYEIREAEGEKIGEGKPHLGYGRRRKNEYQIVDAFVASRNGPMIEVKARASAAA